MRGIINCMKINVVFNKNIENYFEILSELEAALISAKLNFKTFELNSMENWGTFTLVIGGDGTFLKAAKFYSKTQTPVLGINLGRLGFLSQVMSEEIMSLVEQITKGHFITEERMMLSSMGKLALNDFVIKGCNPSRTSKFYLDINGKEVCDYIADGLIISTPTGSTAYGLSAGGPVLHPGMEAIVIVPICPHTLNARPLVVPANETITIKTSDELLSVSIDGSESENCIDKITITSAEKKSILAFLKEGRFYEVLRDKLHWGISEAL